MNKKIHKINNPPPKVGIEIEYHSNGKIASKSAYVNDIWHGVEIDWDENGQKRVERTWKEGKIHGVDRLWCENGQKNYETTLRNHIERGIRTRWYEDGQKEYEVYYIRNKVSARIDWDEEGNVVKIDLSKATTNAIRKLKKSYRRAPEEASYGRIR